MNINAIDVLTIAIYFVVLLAAGFWKGRGKRDTSSQYFVSKGTLPWWVIGAAFVATGMNTEQLIGLNGMAYNVGLPMINIYLIAFAVYSLLIFIFLPVYMRNNIMTMPEYLRKRFGRISADVFTVMLLLSYVFLNLAVVFYGGAKLLEVVLGLDIWYGVMLLGVVAGLYTMYGGMAAISYAAVFQFGMIFVAGAILFILGYIRLPNGWNDVVAASPCGFHLIKSLDYPEIPWLAMPATLLGLQLYYSCINQSLVQRCFGARTHWDARMAIIFAGIFVLFRPFVEVLPGMICRALAVFDPDFALNDQSIDNIFPILVKELIPTGLQGLILVGILSSVMSTIAALLNAISTLFTMDVYKKWINPTAGEHELVKVGTIATLVLMVFCICYSPFVGLLGGSIFNYFQTGAAYVAVPIATVFLFGFFWKRSTSAATLFTLIIGIPLGFGMAWLLPTVLSEDFIAHHGLTGLLPSGDIVTRYGLNNRYIVSGITQILCVVLYVIISLCTRPEPEEKIRPLMWSFDCLFLPKSEPRRPFLQSTPFWWGLFVSAYLLIYYKFW